MKKLFILLVCLLCAGLCRAEESRLIINPGRETFVHFPSEIMGDKIYAYRFFARRICAPFQTLPGGVFVRAGTKAGRGRARISRQRTSVGGGG